MKITPLATELEAEPMVCDMLASRMFPRTTLYAATVMTANRLLPVAKEPTEAQTMMIGRTAERGARRIVEAARIIRMPSGTMMMFAMMKTM